MQKNQGPPFCTYTGVGNIVVFVVKYPGHKVAGRVYKYYGETYTK